MLFWLLPLFSTGNTTGNTDCCCVGALCLSAGSVCETNEMFLMACISCIFASSKRCQKSGISISRSVICVYTFLTSSRDNLSRLVQTAAR